MIKILLCAILIPFNVLMAETPQSVAKDIEKLKEMISSKKRIAFSHQQDGIRDPKELHGIAVAESKLMKLSIAYDSHRFLKSMDIKRDIKEIIQIIDAAFKCSFVFTDVGDTHIERWKRVIGWAYTETNLKNGVVSSWKKGQYIRSLNTTIKYDSTDTGVWQINDVNDYSLIPELYRLYDSGVINFKIKKLKDTPDLFDIQTNCAFRCLVETERRDLNLNWKQDKAKSYLKFISKTIDGLEGSGYYDSKIVEAYYYPFPIKTFSLLGVPK